MATNVLSRRLLAVTVSASLGIFATAIATTPAFAKAKPKKHHHTTTTLKKGKKTTKGAKTTLSATIKKLETSVKSHKSATFIATYKLTSTTKTDKTTSMTIAQEPPKSVFKETSSIFLNTGKTSIFCTLGTTSSSSATSTTGTTGTTVFGGSGPECFKSKTSDPLSSLVDLFSPTEALDFFNQADEQAAAKAAGVSISFTTGTYAGLKSKCVTVKASSAGADDGGKYCISVTGIMDFFTSGGSGATLVKFSTSVPSTTFTTPKGAKIITEADLGA